MALAKKQNCFWKETFHWKHALRTPPAYVTVNHGDNNDNYPTIIYSKHSITIVHMHICYENCTQQKLPFLFMINVKSLLNPSLIFTYDERTKGNRHRAL